MAEEIAQFVAKKLRETFPKGVKAPTSTKRPGSVGELGGSLKQNDPETLKFVAKHTTTEHGDAPKVATKHSLEDPKNARLKGHGKDKEKDVYEEVEPCPKCGSKKPCSAHEKDKKLLLGGGKKLREDTMANRLAMNILEARKSTRFDETVKLSNKQDTGDEEFTKGMETGKASEGEVQTGHKPSGPASNKSKKLDKKETNEESFPHLKKRLDDGNKKKEKPKSEPENKGEKKKYKPFDPDVLKNFAPLKKIPGYQGIEANRIMETIPAGASASDFINDFTHSDNSRFKGKSKTKRRDMALGAYYAKKRSHREDVNAVEPVLEAGKKKKKPVKEESPEEPIRLGKGVPNRYQNIGADTGQVI